MTHQTPPAPFPLEPYVSVDVETSGPNPGQYAMLSIGACLVADTHRRFYVELQPSTLDATPEALAVSGLSLDDLARHGLPPTVAMQHFAGWLADHMPPGVQPVFVGFNAPFDWMFVNDYFHRYLGHNPFGHSALDIKSFYMGLTGVPWSETSMRHVAARYHAEHKVAHQALQDALDQADAFLGMVAEAARRASTNL